MRLQGLVLDGQRFKLLLDLLRIGSVVVQYERTYSAPVEWHEGLEQMIASNDRMMIRRRKFIQRLHPELIREAEFKVIAMGDDLDFPKIRRGARRLID